MLSAYLGRGLKAGLVAGLVFGLFVALVATPMIGFAEQLGGHDHGHADDHTEGSSVAAVASATSVGGGVVFGVLLGFMFGAAFYFLEPAIPGADDTQSYLLAGAGFVTVSGAPWLVVPPQLPGKEALLATDVRIAVYVGMMTVGALVCLAAGIAFNRLQEENWLRERGYGDVIAATGALVPLLALALVGGVLLPVEPVTGSVPETLTTGYQGLVVAGQLGLWATLAAIHAWLFRRAGDDATTTISTTQGLAPADD